MKQLLNTLYINTQGTYLRLEHDTLKLDAEGKTVHQMPLHHLGSIVMFGNVLVSPYLLHRCAEDGRALVWMTRSGRFRGRLHKPVSGNVLLRRAQFEVLSSVEGTLELSKRMVAGKLQNTRQTLLRGGRESKNEEHKSALQNVAQTHANTIKRLPRLKYLDEVRGAEGDAAKLYFGVFDHLILNADFSFNGRNRRPPKDPVNALLSFTYSLLGNECAAACEGVGLDPQMGFLHALRPGRDSLGLDLMEELRSVFADRFVLSLINRQQLKPKDFNERPGGAVELKEDARKDFLIAYQKRKQDEVTHPVLGKPVPYGLIPHIQARLLARHLRGDLPEYQPFFQK